MKKLRVDVNLHNYYFDVDVPDDYLEWDYDVIEEIIKKAFYSIMTFKKHSEKLNMIDIEWNEVD